MGAGTLLVVDDDEDVLDAVSLVLCDEHFAVVKARNRDEALAMARDRKPGVALVDYNMPDVDPTELCRSLRAALPGIKIVLCTGEPDAEALMASLGVDAVLPKPFSIEALVDLVADLGARAGTSPRAPC